MNLEKTIEILRKRNAKLQEENDNLKQQISEINNSSEIVSIKLKDLEDLKNKWNHEIELLQKQRKHYVTLITDIKKLTSIHDDLTYIKNK